MKSTLVLLALFGMYAPVAPSGPATTPNPLYPIRVHILIAKAGGNEGFGRGDIVDATVQGFDYTYSYCDPFFNNAQPAEFYQARWKKPNEKLEILLQKVGSTSTGHCELKIALKAKPYGHYAAAVPPGGAPAAPLPAAGTPAPEVTAR